MPNPPIAFSDDLEEPQPDERRTIDELNQVFDTILKKTAEDHNHAVRAVHAKAHALLQGVFAVEADLPPELAQGLFAQPGTHLAYLRLSTNAGDILPDAISLPRGLALKICGVEGERLPGAGGNAQDFVMVNGPVFQAKTADKFLSNLRMLAKTTDRMEGTKQAVSSVLQGVNKALSAIGLESPKIQSLGGAPNVDPLGETYYSVTPFRYGRHVAKFALVPVSTGLTARSKAEIDAKARPDAIRETLQAEMQTIEGIWEFRVQLCRDLSKQPIEDPTQKWQEDEAPFRRVATLHVHPQDSWDESARAKIDDGMRFDVWTGLAAHRPLGNINRARRDTYRHSANFRAHMNGCPFHEPS